MFQAEFAIQLGWGHQWTFGCSAKHSLCRNVSVAFATLNSHALKYNSAIAAKQCLTKLFGFFVMVANATWMAGRRKSFAQLLRLNAIAIYGRQGLVNCKFIYAPS